MKVVVCAVSFLLATASSRPLLTPSLSLEASDATAGSVRIAMLFATALDEKPDPLVAASSADSSMQNDAKGMHTFLTSKMGWSAGAIRVFDLDWLKNYPTKETSVYHSPANKRAWSAIEELQQAYNESPGATTPATQTLEAQAKAYRKTLARIFIAKVCQCFKDLLAHNSGATHLLMQWSAHGAANGELEVQTEVGGFTVDLKILAEKLLGVMAPPPRTAPDASALAPATTADVSEEATPAARPAELKVVLVVDACFGALAVDAFREGLLARLRAYATRRARERDELRAEEVSGMVRAPTATTTGRRGRGRSARGLTWGGAARETGSAPREARAARETGGTSAFSSAELAAELAVERAATEPAEQNSFAVVEFVGASFGFDGVAMKREERTALTALQPALAMPRHGRWQDNALGLDSAKDWFSYLKSARKEARRWQDEDTRGGGRLEGAFALPPPLQMGYLVSYLIAGLDDVYHQRPPEKERLRVDWGNDVVYGVAKSFQAPVDTVAEAVTVDQFIQGLMDRDRGNTVGGAPPLALFARDSLAAPAKSSIRLEGVFGERRASFKRVAKDMLAGVRATVREHARATDPGLQLAYVVKDATTEERARARAREAFRTRRLLTEALARGEPEEAHSYTPSGMEGRAPVRAGRPQLPGSVAEDTTGAATAARPRFGRRAGRPTTESAPALATGVPVRRENAGQGAPKKEPRTKAPTHGRRKGTRETDGTDYF